MNHLFYAITGLTISKQRLRKFPEKGLKQTADHIEVSPLLLNKIKAYRSGLLLWYHSSYMIITQGKVFTHVILDINVRHAFGV